MNPRYFLKPGALVLLFAFSSVLFLPSLAAAAPDAMLILVGFFVGVRYAMSK